MQGILSNSQDESVKAKGNVLEELFVLYVRILLTGHHAGSGYGRVTGDKDALSKSVVLHGPLPKLTCTCPRIRTKQDVWEALKNDAANWVSVQMRAKGGEGHA